jgi:hypothetical protein
MENKKEWYELIFCVYGCATIEKYKKEIEKINETWGKRSKSFPNVKLLYFLGEEPVEGFDGEEYIYLKGVENDYMSSTYKQYLGLKYIYENYRYSFVFMCGTDTYVNVDKMLYLIKCYHPSEKLYIGGHGYNRTIGDINCYFHDGGGGILVTSALLESLYPLLEDLQRKWIIVCKKNKLTEVVHSADVGIVYFLYKYVSNYKIITLDELFKHCSHKGITYDLNNAFKQCCKKIDITKIVTCHRMLPEDFDEYTKLLIENNYYV